MKDLKRMLRMYRFEFGLLQEEACSMDENEAFAKTLQEGGTLPEGVAPYVYDDGEESGKIFCRVYESDLTPEETAEYLTYQKLKLLRTIKNCVVFFTVLTVIGLISAVLLYLGAFA